MKFYGSLQKVVCPSKNIADYRCIIPQTVDEVKKLATPFYGLKVVHVNATALGGGVAEMLRSIVPLQQSVGLDPSWYVIPPDDAFFEVTKRIHNFMQGQEGELTEEQKDIYLGYNKFIAELLDGVRADVLLIHDPQPAASLTYMANKPTLSVWRCHIDTSSPNVSAWNFLLPFIRTYDRFVFTMKEYAHNDCVSDKLHIITPVIDPFCLKNTPLNKPEAKEYLEQFGIKSGNPLITQISRFDPWKDPMGVVDSYRLAKKQFPRLQLAMVAQMATDDPEGEVVFAQVKDYVGKEEGIHLLVNLPDNDRAVNAFQTASDIILQKSIKEGFGLTVTEAMYKGVVVIGGNVGGIKVQIQDGENGFLVNSSAEAAEKIIFLLQHPELRERIALVASDSVKKRFLMPHNILSYLEMFHEALKPAWIRQRLPDSSNVIKTLPVEQ